MNLLLGSRSLELFDSLLASVELRYNKPPQIELPSTLASLWNEPDDPVGRASDQEVTVVLIGVLNYQNTGLSGSGDEDAKTALAAYRDDGISGLATLEGQFLIAVHDSRDQTIILVPDPNGLRSAFYTEPGCKSGFAFCTNLKTLATALKDPEICDPTYRNFLLSHGFIPFGKTVYREISRLGAKHFLVHRNGTSRLENRSDYLPSPPHSSNCDPVPIDESKLIDELHAAFGTAVQEQMSPDPKVAVLLGGFDSALVAAYLAKAGKEVHTYSFGYNDSSYNQLHTGSVADHIGCTHHWIPMTSGIMHEGLRDFDLYFNAPTNWANYVIQTEAVCRRIRRDGIRHVYSGDGCDSIFLGYPFVHKTSVIFDRIGGWPTSVVDLLVKLLDIGWFDRATGRPYAVALHLIRSLARDLPERHLLTFQIMDANTVRRIQADEYTAAPESNEALLKKLAVPFDGKTPDRIAYGGKSLLSPNLSKMIGSSDSTGTVIQTPYLHPRLKKLALSLPDELCRPKGKNETKITGKYILMRMAEEKKLLPREAIYQKKVSAVDAPMDEWLKQELKDECESFLDDLPFTVESKSKAALFRNKWIEELHRRHVASDNLTVHALSLLLSYARFTKPD